MFALAVVLNNSSFPKKVKGRPFLDGWVECEKHLSSALDPAQMFKLSSLERPPIETIPEFGELLKNCCW